MPLEIVDASALASVETDIASDVAFDEVCRQAGMSAAECSAAKAATGGDLSQLREMAIVGLAGAATGYCASVGGPVLAAFCGALARRFVTSFVDEISGRKEDYKIAPCFDHGAINRAGYAPKFFLAERTPITSQAQFQLELARAFQHFRGAKVIRWRRNPDPELCGGKAGEILFFPNRSWFWNFDDDLLGYIEWPFVASGPFTMAYGMRCRPGAKCLKYAHGDPGWTFPLPSTPKIMRPGHHVTDMTLPDILNSARQFLPPPTPTAPPRPPPPPPPPPPPKASSGSGIKVAIGVGAGVAALAVLSRLVGR